VEVGDTNLFTSVNKYSFFSLLHVFFSMEEEYHIPALVFVVQVKFEDKLTGGGKNKLTIRTGKKTK